MNIELKNKDMFALFKYSQQLIQTKVILTKINQGAQNTMLRRFPSEYHYQNLTM